MFNSIAIAANCFLKKLPKISVALSTAAIIVLEISLATSGIAWSRPGKVMKNPSARNSLFVLKRGSVFPMLEGDLVISDFRIKIEGERRELRTFVFRPRGCVQQNVEINCQAGSQGNVKIPVFYYVTNEKRPAPRAIRLLPPGDADLSSRKLELVDYETAEVIYAGSQSPQQFGLSSGRFRWVQITPNDELSSAMHVALQICDGPSKACESFPKNLINLADLNQIPERSSAEAIGVVPPRPITSKAPAVLPEPSLPGVPNEPLPRPPTGQEPRLPQEQITPNLSQALPNGPVTPPLRLQLQSNPTDETNITINLSIRGIPKGYDGQVVARLVISALSTNSNSDIGARADVGEVYVADGPSESRPGKLIVKRKLLDKLNIAGRPVECKETKCLLEIELREWILYLNALTADEASQARVVPIVQLSGPPTLHLFYKWLQINDQYLPTLRPADVPFAHLRIYLFDNSLVKLTLGKHSVDNIPPILIPSDHSLGALSLSNTPDSGWILKPSLPLGQESTPTVSKQTPKGGPPKKTHAVSVQPPPPPRAHIILQARVEKAGWPSERSNQRLLRILQSKQDEPFRAVLFSSDQRPFESTDSKVVPSKDGLIVWSGEIPQGSNLWHVQFSGLPSDLQMPREISFETATFSDGRINTNDRIAHVVVNIPELLLYESWNLNILAVNRIYGRDVPVETNELCEPHLILQGDSKESGLDVILNPSSQGAMRVFRSVNPLDWSQLIEAKKAQLEIRAHGGSARCVPSQTDLPRPAQWNASDDSTGANLSTLVVLSPRGRWLLGLYAPQDIGVGIPTAGLRIAEAQNEIFNRLTTFLDDSRERYFRNSEPARSALGFDLALLSGADATISDSVPFAEANVITGQYRTSPTQLFRLDRQGDQRLNAFMSGPKGAGGAPPLAAVDRSIRRYAALFGKLSDDRPPIVIYVGAMRPLPSSCDEWTSMTQSLFKLPGKPRVVGVTFVNSAAAEIERDLGRNSQAQVEHFTRASLGFSCEVGKQSLLLIVPFPDLVANSPGLILDGVFRRLDDWLASVERN
jgi:hypothetical protein